MIKQIVALALAVAALLLPTAALAYIGPGAGASLAGSLLAVLAAIATAVAIVLFWPLRLLYKKIKGATRAVPDTAQELQSAEESTTSRAAE